MNASSIIEHVRSFSFANKRWNWDKVGGIVECEPGTWCKPPNDIGSPDWAALVCCPKCQIPAAISSLVHKIDHRGKLNKEWSCPKCKLTLHALLNAWGKQTLFGIAYEDAGRPKMIYKHADSVKQAKSEFTRSYPMANIQLVAIGQVLGYYSEDRDDKILTTS